MNKNSLGHSIAKRNTYYSRKKGEGYTSTRQMHEFGYIIDETKNSI